MIQHHFNHDICLNPSDRAAAASRWPCLRAVVADDALPRIFEGYETTARRDKTAVRWIGTISVGLGVTALLATGAELAGIVRFREFSQWTAIAALLSLVCALAVSRYLPLRRGWLACRFATELLRRQRFRSVLSGVHDSAALTALETDLERSVDARMREFMSGDPLEIGPRPVRLPLDAASRAQVIDAYFVLRLQHQLDYATHKTSPADRTFLGISGSALVAVTDQLAALTLFGAIGCGAVAAARLWHSRWLPALAVSFTLAAVALRAWRDGLALSEDQRRYARYRRQLSILRDRWGRAQSDAEFLEIAEAVERASEEELREFLTVHERAQFLV